MFKAPIFTVFSDSKFHANAVMGIPNFAGC